MSQSNIIAGFVFLAFVVYVTLKGELKTYMGFFVPGKATSANKSGTGTGSPVGTFLGVPGITTLSPGATGIVQVPNGTELLNPGQSYNPFSGFSINGVGNWLGGLFNSKPYTSGQ